MCPPAKGSVLGGLVLQQAGTDFRQAHKGRDDGRHMEGDAGGLVLDDELETIAFARQAADPASVKEPRAAGSFLSSPKHFGA